MVIKQASSNSSIVPWELYHSSRARRTHPSIPPSLDSVHAKLAMSELQRLEFIYLSMSIVSPFVGAGLLSYVLDTFSGAESMSWFNATLFVLATGIRPW